MTTTVVTSWTAVPARGFHYKYALGILVAGISGFWGTLGPLQSRSSGVFTSSRVAHCIDSHGIRSTVLIHPPIFIHIVLFANIADTLAAVCETSDVVTCADWCGQVRKTRCIRHGSAWTSHRITATNGTLHNLGTAAISEAGGALKMRAALS
jgi:hypothetical protein